MKIIQGWAQVASAPDEVGAGLLAERLRSHGIESSVLSQKDRWHVVSFGGLAVIRVLVPGPSYEEAVAVLRSEANAGVDPMSAS